MTQAKKKTEEVAAVKPIKAEGSVKPKGKFIAVLGKRKTAAAQVRLYNSGTGVIVVNGEKINQYFTPDFITILSVPLKLTGHLKDLDFSILVKGGGKKAQAEAARHGISRALIELNSELRPALKAKDLLTRDARKKERKKPGLKKARRAPQWAKR